VQNAALLDQVLKSPEPHARIAANTVKHLWFNVEASTRGGVIAGLAEVAAQKSGILSDTPALTTIRIATVPEKMMYDVKQLAVKPGKKIKLTFANPDFMPHNMLLVKPGKADEIGLKAMALGAKGFDVGFVPQSPDILWASKLIDQGAGHRVHRAYDGRRLPLRLHVPRPPPHHARHAHRGEQSRGVPREESRGRAQNHRVEAR
jgi:plastocyanin